MSGLINLVKGLISGIFGFLGGLLGSKKEGKAISEGQSQPAKPKKSNGYFLELDDAKGVSSSSNGAVAKVAESVKNPAAAVAKVAESVKKPEPVAAKAEPAKKPEPVAAAKALNLPEPKVTNFATDYLLPTSTNGRRRPGANMSSYLNLARQVKTPG